MKVLRTPDDRFADLPDLPFEPRYVTIDEPEVTEGPDGPGRLRIHHLDEGPADGPVVLLMHGEPSWCFLYRHMVAPLVDAGFRVVAPDLVGFGRSDKPTEQDDYTYARHVEWMRKALLDESGLGLEDITFFGQDWGGLVGLRLVAEHPERYARVVVGNTGLPTGDAPLTDAFFAWQRFSQEVDEFPVGGIIDGGCTTDLGPEVVAAYDAPFPDETYKAGARRFPMLVPSTPEDPAAADNHAAWESLRRFDRPWLTAFSDQDLITKGGYAVFQREVPGAKDQPHTTIEGGGHFLQEDRGPELAAVIIDHVRRDIANASS
jgi:haloalkane dehalogenase